MDNIAELVDRRADTTPDLVAFVDPDGATITFGEYRARVHALADRLAEGGVTEGTAVCWQLPTSQFAIDLVAALSRLGAVQNPILPLFGRRELTFILGQVRPQVFVTAGVWRGVDFATMADEVLGDVAPACGHWVVEGDDVVRPATSAAAPPLVRFADEVRWVFFSSGTTSDPKGALHTDRSVAAGAHEIVDAYGVTAADRYPIVFPFTHVGGIQMLVVQLLTGASAIVLDGFDPATTPQILAARGTTILAGGTPMANLMVAQQRPRPDDPMFPDLRITLTGAAPKPAWLHAAIRDELGGVGALSCYGLTEAPMGVMSRLDDTDDRLATTEGRAIGGSELRVVDAEGQVVGADRPGELHVRGPQVCVGYLDASLDADAFTSDGWFRTGDLATLDAGGYLRIVGRIKDVIIRKGENIPATEVEEVISSMPGVDDVAVIGLPDDERGELCCAVVIAAPGGPEPTLDDVVAHCRAQGLARVKAPERLELLTELPRNASGKVLKHELQERFGAARRTDG